MKLPKRILIVMFCITLISGSDSFALQGIHNARTNSALKLKLSTAAHARSGESLLSARRSINQLHRAVLNDELFDGDASARDQSSMENNRHPSGASLTLTDTSMMILVCAGMIVLQLRRKQKSLHQRPLVSL